MACSVPVMAHDGSEFTKQQRGHQRGLIGDSRAAAYGILISRIAGFGRVAAAGAVLGPTFFGNLFQTAAVLPSTLYGLLVGMLISAVLVPPLVQRINGRDRNSVHAFANSALGLVTAILSGVAILIVIASPLLVRAMTWGIPDPETRRHQILLGIPLLMTLTPQVIFYGLAGVGMAVQQAHGRFLLCSVAPAIENVTIIAVLATSAILFGVGTESSSISMENVLLLGIGTTSAVAIHAGIQWIGAYRLGVPLVPTFGLRDPALRQLLRKGAASTGFNALYLLAYLVLLIIAGGVPGGVAAFQIAYNFSHLPVALTALPIAAAQLPRLSACHQRAALARLQAIYRDGFRLMSFAAVPAAVLLVAIPRPLAAATAFGAMDTPAAVSMITICICSLGFGVIGECMLFMATSSCYACQDHVRPLRAVALRLSVFGIGAAVAWAVSSSGYLQLWLLGGALASANLVAGVYLNDSFRRRSLPTRGLQGDGILSAFIVAALSITPAGLLSRYFAIDSGPEYRRAGLAAVALAASTFAYFALQLVRGSPEARALLPAFLSIRPVAQNWRGREQYRHRMSPATVPEATPENPADGSASGSPH